MNEKMTQEQRLDTLVEAFKADSVQYKDMQTPADTEGKKANPPFPDEHSYAEKAGRFGTDRTG